MSAAEPRGNALATGIAFDVAVERDGRDVRVAPSGELDLSTAGVLADHLGPETCDGHDRVVLDLRGVEFMDSTGLRLILTTDARLRAAGQELRLVPGPPIVQRIFELTHLHTVLQFEPI
jgi:anti-sigma B factor antagonist